MKIKLELKGILNPDLLTFNKGIYTAIATNPLIPTPDPSVALMAAHQSDLETAIDKLNAEKIILEGLNSDIAAAREAIIQDITTQGSTVQTALNKTGNPDCAIKSGIPLQDERTRTTAVETPKNGSATTGDETGSIDWHCDAVPKGKYYSVQTCLGDPNIAANWKLAKGSTKSNGTVTDFTAAAIVWLRLSVEGPNDLTSGWSAPFQGVAGI